DPAPLASQGLDGVLRRHRAPHELDEDLRAGRRAEDAGLAPEPPRGLGLELRRPRPEREYVRGHPLGVRAENRPEAILPDPAVSGEGRGGVAPMGRNLPREPLDLVAREIAARTEEAHERLPLRAGRRGDEIAFAKDEAANDLLVLEAERARQAPRDR